MRGTSMVAVFALFAPTLASAAEWGLGTTVGSDGGTLYVPFKVGESMRVEPFGGYFRSEIDTPVGTAGFGGLSAGLGVFRTVALGERFQSYAGGRVAYLYAENEVAGGPDETASGFSIEPVLGGEAFLLPPLSLSVEVFAHYSEMDASGTANDSTSYETGSRLVARFFFQ